MARAFIGDLIGSSFSGGGGIWINGKRVDSSGHGGGGGGEELILGFDEPTKFKFMGLDLRGQRLVRRDDKVYLDDKPIELKALSPPPPSSSSSSATIPRVDSKSRFVVEVEGDVKGSISSHNGDISVKGVTGGGCKTTNGNIEVGGSVTGSCSTTNGSIHVDGPVSGSCSSTNGSVRSGRR